MLRLRRIEIDNFVCFDNLVIEPSIEPNRPLTVIRAENGSGKTTFLRALRWGMYGERGLPGNSTQFSLHPAWWKPNSDGIKTKVTIEFETDGSNRDSTTGNPTNTIYQLVRSVFTTGKTTSRGDEPDFHRINEQTQLMFKEGDGYWSPHNAGVDAVIESLLPWSLRDFFVMDADAVTDFVGGSENKTMSRREVIGKTTGAVHSLLGINIFKEASKRIENIARDFGRQATRSIRDADLNTLQDELDSFRNESDKLKKDISDHTFKKTKLELHRRQRQEDLSKEMKGIGAAEVLRIRIIENRKEQEKVTKERKTTLANLASELESPDLLASLTSSKIESAYEMLRPLYDKGHIPLKHLHFVRDLIESGTCVCGQDLSENSVYRQNVADQIAKSAKQEERANFLGQLYESARSLRNLAERTNWNGRSWKLASNLAELDEDLTNLKLEKRDIDKKLNELDEEKIRLIQDEIDALDTQVENLGNSLAVYENELPQLKSKIDSHQKKINQQQRKQRVSADKRNAETMARLLVDVLNRAYNTIQDEQVRELDRRMNHLFVQMAANVSDDDYEELQRDKATLRMIAQVGLRRSDHNPEEYEIYALNSRERPMPPTEINGASRRVLALSFVLALCAESRTYAPLIADSLLNFMSGTVRHNTLSVTAKNSSQPILLLTGSDLQSPSEAELVARYAGATYTLTGQWDAIDAGLGGDVINWTKKRQVSLICPCGPRQYCDLCERTGQADLAGWKRQT